MREICLAPQPIALCTNLQPLNFANHNAIVRSQRPRALRLKMALCLLRVNFSKSIVSLPGSSKTSQSETELPLLRHKYPREDTILHSLIYRGMPLTKIFVNEVGIPTTRLMPWNIPSNSNPPRLSPRQIRTGSELCSAKECSDDFASLRKLPNQTKVYVKFR